MSGDTKESYVFRQMVSTRVMCIIHLVYKRVIISCIGDSSSPVAVTRSSRYAVCLWGIELNVLVLE